MLGLPCDNKRCPSPAQVGSRVGVLWGVLWVVPEVRTQRLQLGRISLPGGAVVEPALDVAILVLSWSISEITRYTFYFCKARVLSAFCAPAIAARSRSSADGLTRCALQECGYVPRLVLWYRYSGFLILYPAGV